MLTLMVGVGTGEAVVGTGCGGTVVGAGIGGAVVGIPGRYASGDAGADAPVVSGSAVTVVTGRGTTVNWCATGSPGAKLITGRGASTGPAAVLVRNCVTVRISGLPCTISRTIWAGE
jgi:hypothetical protein